jgi:hypothetical protein
MGTLQTAQEGAVRIIRRAQVRDHFHQLTAFEQAEMILYAALDPAVAGKARKGDFVRCLDHFKLLQSPIN